MATIEEFAAKCFEARDVVHREHWRVTGTGSFAAHSALGDLYEAIPGHIDHIVEVCQGQFGPLGPFGVRVMAPTPDIIKYLREFAAYVTESRAAVAQGSTAVENLIDELLADVFSALYKLTRLK